MALDVITDDIRQAGSQTDYFRGQMPIVHAAPYQVVINADIDNGQTISGQTPLTAINKNVLPNTVPASGTTIYSPSSDYQSDAETIVFTLDSSGDGMIKANDRGDDPEENGANNNLFILKKYVYGYDGSGSNVVREYNIAKLRGPNLSATWMVPDPLFQYYYDHDEDPTTDDILWGDTDNNGKLNDGEKLAVTEMPQNLLDEIRRVRITTIAESSKYDKRYETNGGFLNVTMPSEVYIRNTSLTSAMIRGRVFHDVNTDGVIDPGESGIPGVKITLAGQGRSVLSDHFGTFFVPLPAGSYSVQEVDPPGYTSTTANLVSITLTSGMVKVVNFGDVSSAPNGVICGVVYEDENKDGVKALSEKGINNVVISLDDGTEVMTDINGRYSIAVSQGAYTVVETDPINYSSTTSNSGTANIINQDDTVVVDFGDYAGEVYGTLEGYVYLDENEDGIRNSLEEKIPNVMIVVSNGDSTQTSAKGYYKFSLTPGIYSVVERDAAGYTSSTVNTYSGIVIAVDTTVTRDFGDILQNTQNFVEIHISNTERVLSVCTANLKEDDKSDVDIILGTALVGGVGNMLIFFNDWENSTTPVSELFNSAPDYRRDAGDNINAMGSYDFSGDGTPDVLSGLDNATEKNLQIWVTAGGGVLGTGPDVAYYTSGLNEVMDNSLADLDRDGNIDLVVGLKSPIGTAGAFETFEGSGGGLFSNWRYKTDAGPVDNYPLGEIWAIDTGDIDGDGDMDIVIGSHTSSYTGYIDVYINIGYASGNFAWTSRYISFGAVNDLKVLDMMEDSNGDPDIVVAVNTKANEGEILLWLNDGGTFGVPDTTGYIFPPDVTANMPDDYVITDGEALSLAILNVNNDVFPDIAYGTRSSSLYTGDVYVLPTYGTLPMNGTKINQTASGEIISIDVADFNKDSRPDIVVGTRSSATQGRLVAYFGREL
ncbi:VCBS repeat-containing protein [bacterium]|nr:VCBS repeat-containing protein [bacterium]